MSTFFRNMSLMHAIGLFLIAPAVAQTPVGTAFTYQGQLKLSGSPLNATADFQFRLFDALTAGNLIAGPVAVNNVTVANGLFTAQIDFGATAFNGQARFIEIATRSPAGGGAFTTLTPRQTVSATPYALKVPGIDGHSLDAADGSPIDAVFVDNAGNVGIGTTTPAFKLDVKAFPIRFDLSGNGGGQLRLANNPNDNKVYIEAFNSVGGNANAHMVLAGAGAAPVPSLSLDAVTTNITGKVGIGTTSPAESLHIAAPIPALVLQDSDSTTNQAGFLSLRDSGGLEQGWTGFGSQVNAHMHLWNKRPGGNTALAAGNAERLTITPNGNVGIGTTNPQAVLDVASGTGSYVRVDNTFGDLHANGGTDGAWGIYNDTGATGRTEIIGQGVPRLAVLNTGNVGIGTNTPAAKLHVIGTTRTTVLEITGADLAEKFPTSDKVEPGMVVAIDSASAGKLCLARGAYNRAVAGVVSGANDFSAGAVLGNLPGHEDAPAVALSGRVYVLCDAADAAIEPGDLLTTSSVPGHAMKAVDLERTMGAVLGKAMTRLAQGERGLVLVLVSLQ